MDPKSLTGLSLASMIDNLQVHYLEQVELALTTALHGRLSAGVDILLELRLKPDLSMYTRAIVNLSLADLTTFEQHPDKVKFARESLRLAKELQEESAADGSAFWRETYADLIDRSVKKVRSLEAEEAKFLEVLKNNVKGGAGSEEAVGDLSLVAGEQHEVSGRSKAIAVDKDKHPIAKTMVDIEGTFSLKLNSSFAGSGTSSTSMSEASDEVRDLSVITEAGRTENSLQIPPTSFSSRSVQPE
ncbi:hypothetical protein LTR24_001945 [Lithohypha guttulata]|uniref:Uncharacterized protein n=1 Tax=Lithohypha guttulata TaxID=1690604 RepID=A0ABR0KJ92_9EURO|nr:hypothetical protein LTR24_001945 [Lithohypha guttulata]